MNAENTLTLADRWLQKRLSWTPGQLDAIKTVALLLMVLDHTNRILHLDYSGLMLAGRGAFPLFGLVWAYNVCRYPVIRQTSLNPLWAWALLAQLSYVVAGFPWWQGNILFAFAVTGQAIRLFEMQTRLTISLSVLLVAVWMPLSLTSYGLAGVFMLITSRRLFCAASPAERLGCGALWGLMVLMLNADVSPAAAVAGLIASGITLSIVSHAEGSFKRFWAKDFFVLFYVGHLVVLGLLAGEL